MKFILKYYEGGNINEKKTTIWMCINHFSFYDGTISFCNRVSLDCYRK